MKIFLIIMVIVALAVILGLVWISFKALRQVQKTAKQHPELQAPLKQRHPQIDKELEDLARQREQLKQKKKSK